MTLSLTIDYMGARGDGVASQDGQRLHIPFTLPGETVEASGTGERLVATRILTPSADRIAPYCPHFGSCGGCSVQHWQADPVAEWKRMRVVTALERVGITTEVSPTLDAHGAGRRRVTLHVRKGETGFEAGFMSAKSHDLINLDRCPLLVEALNPVPDLAREIGHILRGLAKPLDVQASATREGLDLDIRGAGPLPDALRLKLIPFAAEHKLARLTVHGLRILEAHVPTITLRGEKPMQAYVPPGSFLQATEEAETVLAAHALKALKGSKHVLDLFCGLGPFALRLAQHMKVMACDSDKGAIDSLNRSIRANPGIRPIIAEARDLFRRPFYASELKGYDAALIDPPRQGAEAQVREIAKSKLPRLVYISCDAESFARDAKVLVGAGFKLESVVPVDQFRHAPHVEMIGVFQR